jgi:hypothetical protein
MLLYIFWGDEVLLYFIVRVEVVKIQIYFEFKLVCNLQKGLKNYKRFSNFLGNMGWIPADPAWPSFPLVARSLHRGPTALLLHVDRRPSNRARPIPAVKPDR